MSDYEVVFCVVNAGYSELVMDTANKEAEKFFSITIQPDKEIVMILVPSKIKDEVLRAVYRQAGLKSAGQGIAFSLAVDEVVGIAGSQNSVSSSETKSDSSVNASLSGEVSGETSGCVYADD